MQKLIPILTLIPALAFAGGNHGGGWHHGGNPGGGNFPGSSGGFGGTPAPQPIPQPAPITNQGGQGGVGVGQGGIVQGGNIQRGAVSNVVSASTGGVAFNNPRQTPMAYAPSSYSANPCIMNYSAGGSGAPFGFSLGISAESDACNGRADSIRWQEMGMAPTACERMLVDSDENQEALKNSGLNCKDAQRFSAAMPVSYAPPVATPTLDKVAPANEYITRPELDQKLNNAHRLGVTK